jgi:hypothetical protein
MANSAVSALTRIPENAHCIGCGYPLRELPQPRCPECGRGFDPGDPRTFLPSRALSAVERLAGSPPGWIMIAAAVAAGLFTLDAFSLPGAGVAYAFSQTCFWTGLLFALCCFRFAVAETVLKRAGYRQARTGWRRPWKRWVVVPAILAGCWLLGATGLPAQLRFWVSKPALDRFVAAQTVPVVGPSPIRPQWIGLYNVENAFVAPEGVSFMLSSISRRDRLVHGGLVHFFKQDERGRPVTDVGPRLEDGGAIPWRSYISPRIDQTVGPRFGGEWWTFRESWNQ